MPPVFGPRSPSKMRLWSWAAASIRTRSPSVKQMQLASGPSIRSSTTTRARPHRGSARAAWRGAPPPPRPASPQTTTPLPAASPSAFTTTRPSERRAYASAGSSSVKVAYSAVGIPAAAHDLLGEGLRALDRAAAARGAEGRDARCLQPVGEPRHQRRLRAHHHQVDAVRPSPSAPFLPGPPPGWGRGSRPAPCRGSPARRRGADERALGDLPGEGVFTTARADDEDSHENPGL